MARRGMARARPPIAAASGGLVEETRLDGDLAERDLDAAQVGLHDGQQVGQGAGTVWAGLAHRNDLVLMDPERSSAATRSTCASKALASSRSSLVGGGGASGISRSWASAWTSAVEEARRSL